MLGVVGSNLKMVKFFMQHLWMLHDVVVVWPGSCNNVVPGHAALVRFSIPNNTSQQGGQTLTTCCTQQCRVWPELANDVGPTTILGYMYVVLIFCDRLAGS